MSNFLRRLTGGGEPAAEPTQLADIVGEGEYSGLFAGYFLAPDVAARLAMPGGEAPEALHVTIADLGDVASIDDLALMRAISDITRWAAVTGPIPARVSGLARFQGVNDGTQDAIVVLVDAPMLAGERAALLECMALDGATPGHAYTPHITLAYVEPGADWPMATVEPIEFVIDRVTINAGDRSWVVPLGNMGAVVLGEQGSDAQRIFLSESVALAEAPEWINYMPKPGDYGRNGNFRALFTADGNRRFVDNFKGGVYQQHIPIDGEHDLPGTGALGWIEDMRLNDDLSIDARINWTNRGQQMLADDRFRYFSPEYWDAWTDKATGVEYQNVAIGGALCTRPFLKEKSLRPLAATEGEGTPAADAAANHSTTPEGDMTDKQDAANDAAPNTEPEKAQLTEAEAATRKLTEERDEAVRQLAEARAEADKARDESSKLGERIHALEESARTKRFTDEVTGKSAENGKVWPGETAKHVAMLGRLAESFGEDSEAVRDYVSMHRALAEQLGSSKLFEEVGTSKSGGGAATALDEINTRAKALVAEGKAKTLSEGVAAVAEADPALYARYKAEV